MHTNIVKVALVGSPNVGKSSLFNVLTNSYVNVSNYPGTTVDISRSSFRYKGKMYELVDTPGAYSLLPITEEEDVTRKLLFREEFDIVLHVIDAKNIRRMLSMTLELIDGGFNVILVLNMMDEACKLGMRFDIDKLEQRLGIPVIATTIKDKKSLHSLRDIIVNCPRYTPKLFIFSSSIEEVIQMVADHISHAMISPRLAALLLLKRDEELFHCCEIDSTVTAYIEKLRLKYDVPLDYVLAMERQTTIGGIADACVREACRSQGSLSSALGRISREPITGIPILIAVLYFGFYQIVGRFGAGYLVDYLDGTIFAEYVNPVVLFFFHTYVPNAMLQSLFIGEYGLYTLGIRYATIIVLPIVGTFFIVFSLLEDCGYLPRLAMLVDRLCKYMGLNGRFAIPLTLGFGCGTMAVVVTRTLETRRERLLATFLIALAVPCSAQLGLVLALLSYNTMALLIWMVVITMIFLAAGFLCAKLFIDEQSAFYIELPPIRLPMISNVLTKSYTRMAAYYVEILPIFLLTSVVLWLCNVCGILEKLLELFKPIVLFLGLPQDASHVFLYGFFRRDYGAAGLYDLFSQGMLNDRQLLVSAVTLTLFVPCVAQMSVMIKERGMAVSMVMLAVIIVTAFLAGGIVNYLLLLSGIL